MQNFVVNLQNFIVNQQVLWCPLSSGKERCYVSHDKAQAVQNCPSDADTLQPCPALIHCTSASGEIHQKQSDGSCNNGCHCGNEHDLIVHIFHDF